MPPKNTLRSEVDLELAKAKQRLANFESQVAMLPPVSPEMSAEMAFREYYFALLSCIDQPQLYSAILQHFLCGHSMPFPRGVFQDTVYEVETTAFSPDGESRPVLSYPKAGRPRKTAEALQVLLAWLDDPTISMGQLARRLNPKIKPSEIKKTADRLRQQIRSINPQSKPSAKC
jgi:hypothetical protein